MYPLVFVVLSSERATVFHKCGTIGNSKSAPRGHFLSLYLSDTDYCTSFLPKAPTLVFSFQQEVIRT